ncbi:hypothetical protein Tco_0847415 [Tanacetum coccineum]
MEEDDEEKTGFHIEEGVYCFTHMPKELKKFSSYALEDDGEDVEYIQRKLKRVNIKIDPVTSSFGVKEGGFLGYMVTKEGVKADLEKIQAIILGPSPRSPNQIRILFLQLTAISKFIPKLAELKYPIYKARMRLGTVKESGWTNEAEEALRRKEAEGPVVKKFFGQGEKVQETLDENEGGTLNLNRELQTKSTLTPRAWRLYLGKETIEEDSGMGIILVSPEERMHSYVIRLKFNTSDHAIDCEALLAGLAVFVSKGMKDLHVFIESLRLVAQTEGNHMPTTE